MQDFDTGSSFRAHPAGVYALPDAQAELGLAPRPRSQAMRRRVLVFFAVFLVCALASLTYTFMRPAIYLANARVQLTPSDIGPASIAASAAGRDPSPAFLMEVQVLTSRPLLEKVAQRLAADKGQGPSPGDAVSALQEMLTVKPVEGTNVVLLEARGPDRLMVARVVNSVIEIYGEQQATTGESALEGQLREARQAMKLMDDRVTARKKAVEEFRVRSNIMSAERGENETLSRLKGLGESLATTNEREAAAEGKLRALEQAATEGRRSVQSKENPTVAGMELRLSQWRDEYRGLERQFTPQYLEMDPNAKALKIRIANLEQQLESERQKAQQTALAEAREELTSAKATGQKLQQQLSDDRQNAQGFTRRFAEFKAMEEEVQGLDQMRQTARQRLIALEATATERRPRMLVVEAAAVPDSAWSPQYERDAGISIAASLLLGFLAVWFVEFFDRRDPATPGPAAVVIPQPWMPQEAYGRRAVLAAPPATAALAHHGGGATADMALLARPLPRELAQEEVRALLTAASPEHLMVLVCLLCGLSADEVAALRVEHVQEGGDGSILQVPGDAARMLPLVGPLAGLRVSKEASKSATMDVAAQSLPLIPALNGRPLTRDDIAATVASSAFDAGLEQPQSVTPESLRHTYVAFLVRQGLRFGDLGRVVGMLSADMLNALALLAPGGERLPLVAVNRNMPALEALSSDSHPEV